MQYTKVQINNNIRRALENGRSNDDALDLYLKMNMENDLGNERPFIKKGPSPSDIHMNLIGNHVIDKDDFMLEVTKKDKNSAYGSNCRLILSSRYSIAQIAG